MITIDEPQTTAQLRQFAGQVKGLPRGFAESLGWRGDQSDDFYKGLIAGLAIAVVLHKENVPDNIAAGMTAFVADKMAQKEIL